jgi:hypothetical protein
MNPAGIKSGGHGKVDDSHKQKADADSEDRPRAEGRTRRDQNHPEEGHEERNPEPQQPAPPRAVEDQRALGIEISVQRQWAAARRDRSVFPPA